MGKMATESHTSKMRSRHWLFPHTYLILRMSVDTSAMASSLITVISLRAACRAAPERAKTSI